MRYILYLASLFYGVALKAQPAFITDSLTQYIEEGMKDWNIPGLSIVIVKDGKVVHRRGYGLSNVNSKEPVNENTLFMIASNTKLFTGTALANLEFYKKLSLDDKISKYFPNFQLYDKTSSSLVSIRDMLSHRIGTTTFQGDFTFWNGTLTRQQIMDKMKLLRPSTPFRQRYGYCNSCFLTAGEVIPKVTNGISWEQFITDSFIKPLGMTNTYPLSNDIATRKNRATPYTTSYTNQLQQVPYDVWDNIAPAASIVSNVNDLTNWLEFQLDSGRINGKRVMPFSILQRTRDANIVLSSRKSSANPTHFMTYGLGLFSADYNGRQIFNHTGGAGGMVSSLCFVPEEKLGIAILTNNDNQSFFEILRYQILDAYVGMPYKNRSKAALPNFNQEMADQVAQIAKWKESVVAPQKSMVDYSGRYNNAIYGEIEMADKTDHLLIKFKGHNDLTATLKPTKDGEWLLEYNLIEWGIHKTTVTKNKQGKITVTIKANEFIEYDSYEFVKK